MDIAQRIKELEKKLAIQKAYLDARVSFSDDIKKSLDESELNLIATKIKEFCLVQSEGAVQEAETIEKTSDFTADEIKVLKMVAEAALVTSSKPASAVAKAVETPAAPPQAPKTAILMSLESIPVDRRKFANSNERVRIVNMNDTEAVIMTKTDHRFVVPIEDLEFEQP